MLKNTQYPHVFQPLTIRGITLKNRLQYAPTVVLKCSPEGDVTEEMTEYVKWQASTGAAYVTIGNTPVVHEDSSAWLCELNVTSDRCMHGIHQLVNAARDNGAELSVELAHAGRASHTAPGNPALAPSKVPLEGRSADDVKEMDRQDMDYIKQQFCDCARRCKNAGMRIIMIHCAHHNLLGQFISPLSNIRTDEYGGSLENRMRYPLEVLEAVRKTVGDDMVIEIRVSAQEDTPGGLEFDESLRFMTAAEKYVDIIHVSRGNIHGYGGTYTIPTYFKGRQLNVAFAEQVKKAVSIPVAVVGNITSLDEAEEIIKNGKADIVVMAKAYMADGDLVQKSLAGRADTVRPCTRCDLCGKHNAFGLSMRCAVNPLLGSNEKITNTAKNPKNVMVIGGGPGGMMAAQALTQMGHNVTLYEKTDTLGGKLNDAVHASFKEYLRLYLDWDKRMTEQCGAKIVYNTCVTPELVDAEDPDAVVVACGSKYLRPDIPGIELALPLSDVENHRVETGQNVIICGGGLSGLECAIMLGMEGKNVTVIDRFTQERFSTAAHGFIKKDLMLHLEKYNVQLIGERDITAFRPEVLETIAPDGTVHRYAADSFVLALGVSPDNELALTLLGRYPQDVHVIGDCGGPQRTLFDANQEAFHAAARINRE